MSSLNVPTLNQVLLITCFEFNLHVVFLKLDYNLLFRKSTVFVYYYIIFSVCAFPLQIINEGEKYSFL